MTHPYSRKCWCDACRLTGKSRLLGWAVAFFATLLVLMLAAPVVIFFVLEVPFR